MCHRRDQPMRLVPPSGVADSRVICNVSLTCHCMPMVSLSASCPLTCPDIRRRPKCGWRAATRCRPDVMQFFARNFAGVVTERRMLRKKQRPVTRRHCCDNGQLYLYQDHGRLDLPVSCSRRHRAVDSRGQTIGVVLSAERYTAVGSGSSTRPSGSRRW